MIKRLILITLFFQSSYGVQWIVEINHEPVMSMSIKKMRNIIKNDKNEENVYQAMHHLSIKLLRDAERDKTKESFFWALICTLHLLSPDDDIDGRYDDFSHDFEVYYLLLLSPEDRIEIINKVKNMPANRICNLGKKAKNITDKFLKFCDHLIIIYKKEIEKHNLEDAELCKKIKNESLEKKFAYLKSKFHETTNRQYIEKLIELSCSQKDYREALIFILMWQATVCQLEKFDEDDDEFEFDRIYREFARIYRCFNVAEAKNSLKKENFENILQEALARMTIPAPKYNSIKKLLKQYANGVKRWVQSKKIYPPVFYTESFEDMLGLKYFIESN